MGLTSRTPWLTVAIFDTVSSWPVWNAVPDAIADRVAAGQTQIANELRSRTLSTLYHTMRFP